MAGRIRSIKPEILEDDEVVGLSDAAWRLWVSMFVLADDFGNLPSSERFLASRVWQDSSRRLAAILGELRRAHRVNLYAVDGRTYAHICNWEKHQRIDNAGKRKVPPPEEGAPIETFAEIRGESPRLAAGLDGIGLDGMGRDGSAEGTGADAPDQTQVIRKSRGTRLPDDWAPDPIEHAHSWHQIARSRALTVGQVAEAQAKFKDHWRAAPGQRGVKVDWEATWRNWLRGTSAGPAYRPRPGNGVQQQPAEGEQGWKPGLVVNK